MVASRTLFKRNYPLLKVTSVIELIFFIFTQFFFALILLRATDTSFEGLGILSIKPIYLLYGILLGIGVSGVSAFLSQQIIFMLENNKISLHSSSTFSLRSRMKQHHAAKDLLPIYFWNILLLIQFSSEEFIFRGAFFHLFLNNGPIVAIVFSTFLFAVSEIFFIPPNITTLFPMVGTIVMGLTHAYLFSQVPDIFPLIVSHLVYFIFIIL
jgi:membrane protease YdiL (CAAX protease family)